MKVGPFNSALSMAAAIRDGSLTSRQLVDMHIDRIERLDGSINAVVQRNWEGARSRADEADQLVQEWKENKNEIDLGVFHGVPMTIKEGNPTSGFSMCNGDPSMSLPGWIKCENTKSILEKGGAVLIGKTNLPINACDWECNNPVYGRTLNPYNFERTPGGSSGGSAAALAAGFTPIELGSDIGGSIRIPSAFCGVVGHCATRGVLPTMDFQLRIPGPGKLLDRLLNKYLQSLAWMGRHGPMARNVPDVVAMLEVMGGDKAEALERPKQDSRLANYRVAVWRDHPTSPVGQEVTNSINEAVAALQKAGATVEELVPPMDPMETYRLYLIYLSRFMNLHKPKEQRKNAKNGCPEENYPNDVRSPFTDMDLACVNGIPKGTDEELNNAGIVWDEYLKTFDAVLSPIFPCEAFPNANEPTAMLSDAELCSRKLIIDGNEQYYGDALFWVHLSVLLGLPGTGFPTGMTTDGSLPIGIQAMGAKGKDFIVLDVVEKLMKELGSDTLAPPPQFTESSEISSSGNKGVPAS